MPLYFMVETLSGDVPNAQFKRRSCTAPQLALHPALLILNTGNLEPKPVAIFPQRSRALVLEEQGSIAGSSVRL